MGIGSGRRRQSGAAATGAHRLNTSSSESAEWPRRQVDELRTGAGTGAGELSERRGATVRPASGESGHRHTITYWPMALNEWARRAEALQLLSYTHWSALRSAARSA